MILIYHPFRDFKGFQPYSSSDSDVDSEISMSDREMDFIEDDSDVESETENDENKIFKNKIACLVKRFSLTRAATNELLKINREHGHPELPRTREALLCTPMRKIIPRPCSPGHYIHYGIEKSIIRSNYSFLVTEERVEIDINIDGVSLSKSSKRVIWPILGKFVNQLNVAPFIIGMYSGNAHPDNFDEYLEDLVEELNELLHNGVLVTSQKI